MTTRVFLKKRLARSAMRWYSSTNRSLDGSYFLGIEFTSVFTSKSEQDCVSLSRINPPWASSNINPVITLWHEKCRKRTWLLEHVSLSFTLNDSCSCRVRKMYSICLPCETTHLWVWFTYPLQGSKKNEGLRWVSPRVTWRFDLMSLNHLGKKLIQFIWVLKAYNFASKSGHVSWCNIC